jgi:hypothetical protein
VSPRRNRRESSVAQVNGAQVRHGVEAVGSWADGEWRVRAVSGSAGKTYRCPGCDHEIRPGTGHLVAWPADGAVDERRHWHTACWRARLRRGPGVQRSRNAPRYG